MLVVKDIIFILIGVILIGFGAFYSKEASNPSSTKIEVLESESESERAKEIIVEIAGAITNLDVYKFTGDSRVEDLLIASGGVSADADRKWIEKYLNRASRLSDGQKIYIPRSGEENVAGVSDEGSTKKENISEGSGQNKLININTSSQKELESLWGIGPVYAQNIIEHRPYSSVEELQTQKIIKENVYQRNKDLLTVY